MRDLLLPSLGEDVQAGTVIAILVSVGDEVQQDQPLIEVETDKVTAEVPSEISGLVGEILVKIGDEISEGIPFLRISPSHQDSDDGKVLVESAREDNDGALAEIEPIRSAPARTAPPSFASDQPLFTSTIARGADGRSRSRFRSSPLARKLAREIGVEMHLVNPARGTRVTMRDVKNYAKKHLQNRESKPLPRPLPDFERWGPISREAFDGITQATSQNMQQTWSHVPHAWLQETVDITDLEIQRKEQKIAFKQENGTLTLTAILIKALGLLLPQYPRFGASVDGESREIIYKKYVNIAVAIDTERGLLVPVISEADRKSLLEISQSLLQLSEKARKKKIKAADLEGGTFTVSNLGGIGTTGIFPLVNHPQVAILGVSKSTLRPVWRGQQFEPRLLMPLTLGFDHRIINGADAARFLVKLKRLLEVDFTIKSPGQ